MKNKFIISYDTTHEYRGGHTGLRTNSKTVTIPGGAENVRWDTVPKKRKTKQGNEVFGIEVFYRKQVGTRGGGQTVKDFRKVIGLPEDVRNLRIVEEMDSVLEW